MNSTVRRLSVMVTAVSLMLCTADRSATAEEPYLAAQVKDVDRANEAGKFDADWESLAQHEIPQWFKDAKLGIYAHWGVYSVPAFGNEWYPRHMYREGSPTFKHHKQKYGGPGEFGYKDFIPKFTAEKFDAEAWAELYARAGAKFAGPVAEHHDGFSMWDSRVNRWNAADMGPKRDITGELVEALRKRDIKIVTSFHHGFNFQGYYTAKEDWDTADPQYTDLYGQFDDETLAHDRWLVKLKEVIDGYRPDQIWFDFGLRKIPDDYKQRLVAYYYNQETKWNKPVIITRKGTHLPEGVAVVDIERGKMSGMADELWQTDDSVATNSWCYVDGLELKPAEELIHELIDIVSKNGVLLLNVAPKADGSFPDDQRKLLGEIGDWLRVNGEAIYATRPWKFHGEGPHLFDRGRGLGKIKQEQIRFVPEDIRYTQSKDGQTLYAVALGLPKGKLTLTAVRVLKAGPEAAVTLLGRGKVDVTVNEKKQPVIDVGGLSAENAPCKHAFSFKLEGFALDIQPDAVQEAPETEMVHE